MKTWTTNHGALIPRSKISTISFGYRILKSHTEGDVRVIESVKMLHASIFDGTLGPNGPAVLIHREDETTREFATRLTDALIARGQGSEWQ
jgi:hypothetical protein